MYDENSHYFCKINFIKSYDEIEINSKMLKNTISKNKGLLQAYIRKNCPYKIKEIFIGKVRGIEVFLPLTREDAILDIDFYKDIMGDTKADILSCELKIKKFYNVLEPLYMDYSYLNLLCINPMVEYSFESINIKKGLGNICLILTHSDFKNMYVLGNLMDYCKEMFVFSKDISPELKYFIDNIYEEFGIYISIIDDEKVFVDYLITADLTINLDDEEWNIAHKLKSCSSFIDLSKEGINSKEVLRLRDDIFNLYSVNYKIDKQPVTMEECYLTLEILDKNFSEFLKEKDLSITIDTFKYLKVANFVSNKNTFRPSNKLINK